METARVWEGSVIDSKFRLYTLPSSFSVEILCKILRVWKHGSRKILKTITIQERTEIPKLCEAGTDSNPDITMGSHINSLSLEFSTGQWK